MNRFKDKMKEIEKQEELIQRKKTMLDQKVLGQKLIEQQKAMTTSSSEAQSSCQKNISKGTFEPNNNQSHSPQGQVKSPHNLAGKSTSIQNKNVFCNDGSFLKAFKMLQQQKPNGDSESSSQTGDASASGNRNSKEPEGNVHLNNNESRQYQPEHPQEECSFSHLPPPLPPHTSAPGGIQPAPSQCPSSVSGGQPDPCYQNVAQMMPAGPPFQRPPFNNQQCPPFPPNFADPNSFNQQTLPHAHPAQFQRAPNCAFVNQPLPPIGQFGGPLPPQQPNAWPAGHSGNFYPPPFTQTPPRPPPPTSTSFAAQNSPFPGYSLPPPPPPPPPLPPVSITRASQYIEEYDPLRPTDDSDNEGDIDVKSTAIKRRACSDELVMQKKDIQDIQENQKLGGQPQQKIKRSRWGEQEDKDNSATDPSPQPPSPSKIGSTAGMSPRRVAEMIAKSLSASANNDSSSCNNVPSVAVAQRFTGGQVSTDQLKQLKEQQQLKAMEEYIRARQNAQQAAVAMKMGLCVSKPQQAAGAKKRGPKYEYDSDEDIDEDEGTWEHKARRAEMEATKEWACSLDEMSHGKHHIGDFLPPSELKKFMETFDALKEGRTPKFSDYEQFKLTCENVGFQMLQKLGWKEGEGLGSSGQGIVEPVNRGLGFLGDGSLSLNASKTPAVPAPASAAATPTPTGTTGADASLPNNYQLSSEDDEFDAYRKRMMLAYRFRPNPLNNPRRPYY